MMSNCIMVGILLPFKFFKFLFTAIFLLCHFKCEMKNKKKVWEGVRDSAIKRRFAFSWASWASKLKKKGSNLFVKNYILMVKLNGFKCTLVMRVN